MKKNLLIVLLAITSLLAGLYVQHGLKPDFKTVTGESYRWQDLKGEWVVVNYFAEWCAPCLKEVPELNEFHDKAKIPLFGISFDGEPDGKMNEIAARYRMEFPIISAESEANLPMQQPRGLPATFIIDDNGQLRKTLMGEQTYEKLVETIERLKSL